MPPPLLLSVKDAMVKYGNFVVFEGLSFNLHEGGRIALVGKNGAGKTTLMNIITGVQDLDDGERWEEIGTTVGYLRQDIVPKKNQTVFDFIFEEIKAEEQELHAYKVDIVAEALELDINAQMTHLSGGQIRRAGLARALVEEPDILLLDEPTNHLDLDAIEWLEGYLNNYRGTLLCISHDKTFLSNVTNQVFWLDRSSLKVSPRGFKYFDEWSTMLLEQEERELKNRKQIVGMEIEWASKGVKARRKRNQRRLEMVYEAREKLKADESSFRRATAKIQIKGIKDDDNSSKIVAEFYNACKSFERAHNDDGIVILDKFSLRIKRGDRIGIIGKNGSGKTTFLKMLLGEVDPDQGRVKRRKELEFSYFDQKRRDLDPDESLKKTLCPNGGDYLDVMGKSRHVCGYLKDFMFDPARVNDKICQLSGGQKNRLMLAKVLANPKSCLILDEPTNDLDMETLDMLEEILSAYKGTLILVSHDRDFLDQTVTRLLAFEGDGKIENVVGGYSDYLQLRNARGVQGGADKKPLTKTKTPKTVEKETPPEPQMKAKPKKLTYKLERELNQLPKKIEEAEAEIAQYNEKLADVDFYKRDPNSFHEITKSLAEAEVKRERYENRWLELEEMKLEVEEARG
jgi:ATP-binding cassette subfamily F protein uup